MAKQLLLNALVSVLGEFIDISEDNFNLSLAVWSGQIVLHDLKLKTDKFVRNFNISILHGTINRLEINIPWTALLNSPVKILIDGLNLQVGPLNLARMDKVETRNRLMENKRNKLKQAEALFDYSESSTSTPRSAGNSKQKKSSNQDSYMQQMTTKIVDNLEITVKNIHLRYEDSQSIPNSIISAGITLSSFILATCDDKWHEMFIARSSTQTPRTIHKIAKVQGLGIYWNTNSRSFLDLDIDKWIKAMQSQIYKPDVPETGQRLEYVLAPKNNLTIKLTHNEDSNGSLPKFSCIVESTNLPLAIDRNQLNQLSCAFNTISALERKRQPFTYRPSNRPLDSHGCRSWWRYSCKLVIKRSRYIYLYKLSKTIDPETGWEIQLNSTESNEFDELEERIPLPTLIIFRYVALNELISSGAITTGSVDPQLDN